MPFDQLDLKRAMAGDERAMQRLWSQHAPHIDAVVRRLCGDRRAGRRHLAGGLDADLQGAPKLSGRLAIRNVGTSDCGEPHSQRAAQNQAPREAGSDIEDDSAHTEQDSDRTFLAESIEQAMTKLSPGARAVFVLHDIEGYTHGEIGEELGITPGGSKSQLFKARAKLKKLLAHLVDESTTVAGKGKAHVAPV